jgi:GNAT superfamily N-acetyltransferase
MPIFEITSEEDKAGISQFLEVAQNVYRGNPVWISASQNSAISLFNNRQTGSPITHFLVATENNQPVARGAVIINSQARDEDGNLQGWIGFFEAGEAYRHIGENILGRCEAIMRDYGVHSILAPRVDNLLMGLLTDGFELPHTVLSNYNPPYYLEIFKRCGYRVKEKMRTFHFDRSQPLKPRIKLAGFTTREFDRSKLDSEAAIFNKLQSSIFSGTNNYVPRSSTEDRLMIEQFLGFLNDELVIIAEDNSGDAIGLLICLPDVYQSFKKEAVTRARIISIGVAAPWKHKGVGAVMASHLAENLARKGYTELEASWIQADNLLPQNLAKRFKGKPGKEFALLEKKLH